MKRYFPGIFLSLWYCAACGQPINPGKDKIFRPTEVATIWLKMAPADKAFLQNPANASSEDYQSAILHFKNSQMDTTLLTPVGVRLSGNTSRSAKKKSFKIDFRKFDGKKFFNYKKLNLKADVNDPSLLREALTLQQYRLLGVPAARTTHVRFYINNEYMGIYLGVEQVDDIFLTTRYGHADGFLYKCSYGANLSNTAQVNDKGLFESEINESRDIRDEIRHFIEVLNQTKDLQFATEIEKVFEVDSYLRQLAVEALTGHWDGYSYNQNNYYLYYNGKTHKVEFFPYDADNTWGIDWVGQDWAKYNLSHWVASGKPRPLTTRILAVPEYKEAYTAYVQELAQTTFSHPFIDPSLAAYQSMLTSAVKEDTYFTRAFGFTHADFLNSFDKKAGGHVKYGLKTYLDERLRYAREQLPAPSGSNAFSVYPNPAATTSFYFTSTSGAGTTVAVYNSSGEPVKVAVQEVEPYFYKVNLPKDLAPGAYQVQTSRGKRKWTLR